MYERSYTPRLTGSSPGIWSGIAASQAPSPPSSSNTSSSPPSQGSGDSALTVTMLWAAADSVAPMTRISTTHSLSAWPIWRWYSPLGGLSRWHHVSPLQMGLWLEISDMLDDGTELMVTSILGTGVCVLSRDTFCQNCLYYNGNKCWIMLWVGPII